MSGGNGHGPSFWIATVVGGAIMVYGVHGLVAQAGTDSASAVGRWIVGADVLHDALLAPVAIAIGWLAGRLVPGPARVPLQAALLATGVVLLVAWAPLRGYGRAVVPDNPSVQPLDYTSAVATVLALVWGIASVWVGLRIRRARSHGAAAPIGSPGGTGPPVP